MNHVWWWNADSRRAKGWSVHQGRWGRTNVLRTIAKASSIVDHPAQHPLRIHRWCCPCTWEFAKRELSGNKSLGPKKGNEVICWHVQFVRTKTIWGIFLPNSYLKQTFRRVIKFRLCINTELINVIVESFCEKEQDLLFVCIYGTNLSCCVISTTRELQNHRHGLSRFKMFLTKNCNNSDSVFKTYFSLIA